MKKIIFTLFMISVALPCFSQMEYDIKAGVNLSGFSEGENTMRFGFRTSVGIGYRLTELFSVKSGIALSMKGITDGKTPFDFNPLNSLRLTYAEIPLLACFSAALSANTSLSFNAGPYGAYRINSVPSSYEGIKRWDMGVETGVDFLFGKRFLAGVSAQYGLLKVTDGHKSPHNYNYSLMIGYRF